MYPINRISRAFHSAQQIDFDDSSRLILMSDCHRGDGSWADDFSKNQYLYFAAMTYYFNEKYTYIELGDGDELWKNKRISDILPIHSDVFKLLSEFYRENRFYSLYGNHDMVKSNRKYARNNYFHYYDEREKKERPLFENIRFYEGITLRYAPTGDRIYLIHGHQGDFLNDDAWKLGRFLVRHLWKPLELIGVHDPTSTAKNYVKKEDIEKNMMEWAKKEKSMLIAGHTHRPVFPKVGEPLYFNDGSSVHPLSITGIEITNGQISLVKWSVKTRSDGTMFVGRENIAGPTRLTDFFKGKATHIKAVR